MAASDYFYPLAAVLFEFRKQREFFIGGEPVARRVRNHRHAASLCNPAHRVAQRCPAVRHKAGFAFNQVFAKHLAGVFAGFGFDQKARKVRARNQRRVADILQRAFISAVDSDAR